MKINAILLMFTVTLATSSVYSQSKEQKVYDFTKDIRNLKNQDEKTQLIIRIAKSDLKEDMKSSLLQDAQNKSFGYDVDGFALATGIMYIVGEGSKRYISGAYIDGSGVVHARERLDKISRVFPSFTGLIAVEKPWHLGLTLGVNDGVNNQGRGFAVAGGIFIGIYNKGGAHVGLFLGGIFDPTVRRLPHYVRIGFPYPDPEIQDFIKADKTSAAIALSEGVNLPTEEVAGVYRAAGVMFSVAF